MKYKLAFWMRVFALSLFVLMAAYGLSIGELSKTIVFGLSVSAAVSVLGTFIFRCSKCQKSIFSSEVYGLLDNLLWANKHFLPESSCSKCGNDISSD